MLLSMFFSIDFWFESGRAERENKLGIRVYAKKTFRRCRISIGSSVVFFIFRGSRGIIFYDFLVSEIQLFFIDIMWGGGQI